MQHFYCLVSTFQNLNVLDFFAGPTAATISERHNVTTLSTTAKQDLLLEG